MSVTRTWINGYEFDQYEIHAVESLVLAHDPNACMTVTEAFREFVNVQMRMGISLRNFPFQIDVLNTAMGVVFSLWMKEVHDQPVEATKNLATAAVFSALRGD
jgi:hypothetical protein